MIISEANSCVNDNINHSENQEQKLGYVYRHIRLDTNMPFYIGISTLNDGSYKRSKNASRRSKEWKDVISETEYRVDILLENIPIELLGDKEKYFIKLYGRIDLGTGTLVNKNSGGQGNCGAVVSEETRKGMSERNKGNAPMLGKKHTEEAKKKMSDKKKGKTYRLNYKHTQESIEKIKVTRRNKPVGQYDKDGNLIKEYPSILSTKLDGFHIGHVSACCRNNPKYLTHKGYEWRFL